ncbi:MAG: type II toxin-antitoxin system VapC family toxin [Candidatus Riflebacteria bacterium]|nr:type II toxin-antitoxin system VapC family toxin [Candidatus Riflebacteria bacterium]
MKKSNPDCVIDSSVILDYYEVKGLSHLMGFPYRLVTLDLMIHDLEIPTPAEIANSGIISVETPVEIMLAMGQLSAAYKISTFDAALLLYAKTTNSILLSGDKALRNAAKKEGAAVKGTLWVLESLVSNNILKSDQACFILERMFMLGRRLPPDEASSKILKWEQQR